MSTPQPVRAAISGYRGASAAERAGFGMLTAFAATIGVSRAITYGLERNRRGPRLRSWARRAYQTPGTEQFRVHHFLPGMGLAFATGAAAILTRGDGREFWLSVPFGTGAGLTLDEIGLLVKADNPYWGSERLAFAQAALTGLAAASLTIRFHRRGAALAKEPASDRRSPIGEGTAERAAW